MRIFPRYHIPGTRQLRRRLRQARRYMTIARAILMLELLILLFALVFIFTGRRAAVIESTRQYAGLLMLITLLALATLWHLVVGRRIARMIERRFAPAAYDEHRILFDFGQEARAATNIDELYNSIVRRISQALETERVSIFVRTDNRAGDYLCRMMTPTRPGASQRVEQMSARELALARDAFVIKRLRHLSTPLILEPGELETWTRALETELRGEREARLRELQTLKEIKATLLLPVKIKEQLIGLVALGPRRARHKYSSKDKEMLMSMASQLALVMENSRLVERMVFEEQLRRELELAAEVQQGLLPSKPPETRGLDLAGFCQPARGVGGDYYDFILLGNEQVGVAVADVAGKGISAALVMSNVQAALRSQTMARNSTPESMLSLAELVSNINMLMCRSTGPATYVTFFYGQFDEQTRQLAYVNAGHNPPILIHASASSQRPESLQRKDASAAKPASSSGKNGLIRLSMGGPVIGFFEDCHYEQDIIQLEAGDTLVIYTDGVTEALDSSGEEFGDERLKETLRDARHLSAGEIRDHLVNSLRLWCADAPQHDDLTFIVLKVR